jgi:hypothetical protein
LNVQDLVLFVPPKDAIVLIRIITRVTDVECAELVDIIRQASTIRYDVF